MSAILGLTGVSGLAFSFLLLHVGLWRMNWRYPLAVLLAWGTFLLLLRAWLAFERRRFLGRSAHVQSSGGIVDAGGFDLGGLDLGPGASWPGGGAVQSNLVGGGGSSGGAGASSSFELPAQAPRGSGGRGGGSGAGGFSLDLDGDELLVLLVVVLAVGSAVVAAVYVITTAPAFMAELLLDGVFTTSLYRRMAKLERRSWLECAVRHTILPVAAVAFFFGLAGYVMHGYAPEARSMREVWQHHEARLQEAR